MANVTVVAFLTHYLDELQTVVNDMQRQCGDMPKPDCGCEFCLAVADAMEHADQAVGWLRRAIQIEEQTE